MAAIITRPRPLPWQGRSPRCPQEHGHGHRHQGSMPRAAPDDGDRQVHQPQGHPERSKIEPTSTNIGMASSGYLPSPA